MGHGSKAPGANETLREVARAVQEKGGFGLVQHAFLQMVEPDFQEAMDIIEAVPGVKEVALFGSGLHVIVEEAAPAAGAIQKRLAGQGFQVSRIEKIVPSLEDVFVSLIEARDRAGKPQPEVRT